MNAQNDWKRTEFYFFCLVTALTTYPVLFVRYFTSSDGPAHLYNAKLSFQLLKGDPFTSSFLSFNPVPVPNWLSNALLIPLSEVLPSFLAEKILLLSYIILLPFSFRYFIKCYQGEILISYFIFPLVFSFQFCMGFYNFSLSLVLMFFALGFYFKNADKITVATTSLLALILLCTYFAHIFIVVFTIATILSAYCIQCIYQYLHKLPLEKDIVRKLLFLLLSFFPVLILVLLFFMNRPDSPSYEFLSLRELIGQLLSLRPAYNSQLEKTFATIIAGIVFTVLVTGISFTAKKYRTQLKPKNSAGPKHHENPVTHSFLIKSRLNLQSVFHPKLLFAWICGALLVFYFIAPDGDGWAGYVSVRTALVFYLALIAFISVLKIPGKLLYTCIACILILHVVLLGKKYGTLKRNQSRYEELTILATHIEDQKILIPVNLSDKWDVGHLSNYLGTLKHLIILENYEASTRYFPLVWQQNMTNVRIGNIESGNIPLRWESGNSEISKSADYVLVIGKPEPEKIRLHQKLFDQLNLSYYLKKETAFFTLYQQK